MIFFIGHRGVGKTSFARHFEDSYDLDALIGNEAQIFKIFEEKGEEEFRTLEFRTLDQLLSDKKPKVVVLGAGFKLEEYPFPKEAFFIWIQRESDKTGRIFLDRPRLIKDIDPLTEFLDLKQKRDQIFSKISDFSFLLEEGPFTLEESSAYLKKLLNSRERSADGSGGDSWNGDKDSDSNNSNSIDSSHNHSHSKSQNQNQIHKSQNNFYTPLNFSELYFFKGPSELRTDVFSEAQILKTLNQNYDRIFVVAFRGQKPSKDFVSKLESLSVLVDVPLELFPNYDFQYKADYFYSLHKKPSEKELKSILIQVKKLKWAPLIKNFEELVKWDTFLNDEIKNRYTEQTKHLKTQRGGGETLSDKKVSFLPRDQAGLGRFRWYRIVCRFDNFINYFRFGLNDFLDQPAYFDDLYLDSNKYKNGSMGAVLGGDTRLSHSPSFHRKYFATKMNSNYLSVSLNTVTADLKEVFDFLESKNIRFLSVTAPFKKDVAQLAKTSEPQNTVFLKSKPTTRKDEIFKTTNTDKVSIEKLIKKIEDLNLKVCIWGQGAMGQLIYDQLKTKNKQIRSVRKSSNVAVEAQILIWACGAETNALPFFKEGAKPLKYIFDLEYKEHSFARKLAQDSGAKYISGEDFFINQAEAQQQFFSLHYKENL